MAIISPNLPMIKGKAGHPGYSSFEQ